ncbi:30S ribosomal protein S6 [candidate division KSB3 bacterium]|uniref:Small ribosomal subunit protein bS6 n=1 Tax=candidate division KSB3 bacterium TaxID=2044937 RepID=A0A2G6KHL6_9BACT|nr:MAG: 30S ribosomal protein S6 [candidate division KSB3 bacterium]
MGSAPCSKPQAVFRAVEPQGGSIRVQTYESLFIVHPDLDGSAVDSTIEAIQDVITSGGGNILKIDKWGLRQLAYMIQKKQEGYYVLMYFEAPPTLIAELNRRYKLTDAIMRNLVVQLNPVQIAEALDEKSVEEEASKETLGESENTKTDADEATFGADEVLVASTEG